MTKKQAPAPLSAAAQAVLDHAQVKHANAEAAWASLCQLLETHFKDDPDGLADLTPTLLKALSKWSKRGQGPLPRWLHSLDAHAHLFVVCQEIALSGYGQHALTPALVTRLLALPMPRLRRLELSHFELEQDAFEALIANESLSALASLKLANTGLRDLWLPTLLSEGALWTSLSELFISEARIRAKGAALIADCPHLSKLATLSLKGCPIGDDGRRALGASPHLSDSAKNRARAIVSASNEAAAQAPPSPRDAFGDVRSLLQEAPSAHAWAKLCDLFDRLHHSPDKDRLQVELVPYTQQALARWPDDLLVCPPSWAEAVMEGAAPPAGMALCASLHLIEGSVRADRIKRLVDTQALPALRHVRFRENSVSAKTLLTLFEGAADTLETLEIDSNDSSIGQLKAVAHPKGPRRLKRLAVIRQQQTGKDIAPLADALCMDSLEHLALSATYASHDALEAVCALPCAPRLKTLDLSRATLRNQSLRDDLRLPAALTSLSLSSTDAFNDATSASIMDWISSCDSLHHLGLHHTAFTARMANAKLTAFAPASLTSLSLSPRQALSWTSALPASLRDVTLELDYAERAVNAPVMALLRSPQAHQLRSITLKFCTIDAPSLRARPADLPAIERLRLWMPQQEQSSLPTLFSNLLTPRLTELWLERLPIDLAALDALAAQPWWPSLKALHLSSSRYTNLSPHPDREVAALAALPASLESLEITAFDLSNRHLEALLASPAAPSLRTLRLHNNNLSPGALALITAALPDLTRLEALDLAANTSLTAQEITALAASPHAARLSRLSLAATRLHLNTKQALMSSPCLMLSAKDSFSHHMSGLDEIWS